MRAARMLAAAALVLSAAACDTPDLFTGSPPVAAPLPSTSAPLPDGWRWESYGGIEVGVPGDYGWGNGSQRLGQWCVHGDRPDRRAIVGRPGIATAAGCGPTGSGTLLKNTGTVVGLARTAEGPGVIRQGDRTTVRTSGVEVAVQAPADVRERIAATVRRVDVDSFGCPATHPVSGQVRRRPRPVDVASLRAVTTVSACKYDIGSEPPAVPPRLISALRLDGPAARQALDGIAAAPVGGGPDEPSLCSPEASFGDDVIVLRVRSSTGDSEIIVRYSGCDHHGFDDGVAVRTLTAPSVAPFVAGPNLVQGISGGPPMEAILPTPR